VLVAFCFLHDASSVFDICSDFFIGFFAKPIAIFP